MFFAGRGVLWDGGNDCFGFCFLGGGGEWGGAGLSLGYGVVE